MSYEPNKTWEDLSLYYKYIKDIDHYPLLVKKEEQELLKKVRSNNRAAINKLVCSNLKFVINVAFKYRGQGFTLPELINEGNIGLIEAAKRFDINKKIRFISYAVWWIRQAITRAISEKARMVRISAEKELILRRINKHSVRTQYVIGGGLKIDARKLGRKMGYSKHQMEKILEMGQLHSSLDQTMGNESSVTVKDMITDPKEDAPDEVAIRNSRDIFLENSLNKLSAQERKVIKMYFGIESRKGLSLEDIGDLIGLSKERVRQIKEEGLENLRKFELPRELLLAA